jgi:glutathione S-transferase
VGRLDAGTGQGHGVVSGRLVLYIDAHWANTWDCGPYVALREKGLEFSTAIALVRSGVNPGIRQHAYTGLEPALQHGDFWVAESMAIIEYVEDCFQPPTWPRLFPADVRERARARQLMSWLRSELNDLRSARPSTILFYPRRDLPPLEGAALRQAANLVSVVERLAPSSQGTLFPSGWCIADVEIAFALRRLICTDFALPQAVVDYANAVWRRPAVREYVEHGRPPHPPE